MRNRGVWETRVHGGDPFCCLAPVGKLRVEFEEYRFQLFQDTAAP